MTDKEREEKQRIQVKAIDEVRSLMSKSNITFRHHLLDLLDLKDVVFATAGCLIAGYRWQEALEELNVIASMAMLDKQREVAANAIKEIEKIWDYLGLQLSPTSIYAMAALEEGRFDLYTKIIR